MILFLMRSGLGIDKMGLQSGREKHRGKGGLTPWIFL